MTSFNKQISIIIPTYQTGGYFVELLDCLGRQTVTKDAFEVIVVLNGPRDPYWDDIAAELEKMREGGAQCRLLYSTHKGVSNARNVGIEAASHEYLLFLDDDDLISDGFVEDMLSKANEDVIVASKFMSFTDSPSQARPDYVGRCYECCAKAGTYRLLKYRGFLSSSCGKVIPAMIIGDTRFKTEFSIGEDSLFMFEISKNIRRIVLAEESSVYFRRNRESSARSLHNKCGVTTAITQWTKSALAYTTLYLKAPFRYHFAFYLTRLLAITKFLFMRIKL